MTLEGWSTACAKLEPASSKNNEILEINVLQKFTSHALYQKQSSSTKSHALKSTFLMSLQQ